MKKWLSIIVAFALVGNVSLTTVSAEALSLGDVVVRVAQANEDVATLTSTLEGSMDLLSGTQKFQAGTVHGEASIDWLEFVGQANLLLNTLEGDSKITAVLKDNQTTVDIDGNVMKQQVANALQVKFVLAFGSKWMVKELPKFTDDVNRWQDVFEVEEAETDYVIRLKKGLDGQAVYAAHQQAFEWIVATATSDPEEDAEAKENIKYWLSEAGIKQMLAVNPDFEIRIAKADMKISSIGLKVDVPYENEEAEAVFSIDHVRVELSSFFKYNETVTIQQP